MKYLKNTENNDGTYEHNYGSGGGQQELMPIFQKYVQSEVVQTPELYSNQKWMKGPETPMMNSRNKPNLLQRNLSTPQMSTDYKTLQKNLSQNFNKQEFYDTPHKLQQDQDTKSRNPFVESLIKVQDAVTGHLVNFRMPSSSSLSKVSSQQFLKQFKSISDQVKSELGKSRVFRDSQRRSILFDETSSNYSSVPCPGTYNVDDRLSRQSSKSRNQQNVGFNSSLRRSIVFNSNVDFYPERISELTEKESEINQIKNRTVQMDKQTGRDDIPILYNKKVVQELNKYYIKQEQLAKKALMQNIEGDQKRVQIIARDLVMQPMIFNTDKAKVKRISFQKRLGNFKESIRQFQPEKGQKLQITAFDEDQ
ncbi:UNKNOWN [Stylonychia lemnae]|uniref:Uncharacterized protein n=1 Tax=Stylonychia lemnae TaxID=5949 RepID=A0A078AQJ9_STYLE|nr:UNKNOWN [Stylonychia lemnae]|eukprot:CDW84710.1 UNKNOWN [Stylonychia lemnae]